MKTELILSLYLICFVFFAAGEYKLKRSVLQTSRQVKITISAAAQNSQMSGHPANLAIDGNNSTYSSTSGTGVPTPETWQGLFDGYYYIDSVTIKNTQDNQSRFANVAFEVLQFTGDINNDFASGTENEKSRLSSGQPEYVILNIVNDVLFNCIRISRTTSPASSTLVTTEDRNVLAIAEVEILGVRNPCFPSCADANAECLGEGREATCVCKVGFYNDGNLCQPTKGEPQLITFNFPEVTTSYLEASFSSALVSPVVVCSPSYTIPHSPTVVRVANVTSSGFQVRVQSASSEDSPLPPTNVHCIVAEEGIYTGMEARIYTTDRADYDGTWPGTIKLYRYAFKEPVVVGQVMSDKDPIWSVFWASKEDDVTLPPSATDGFRSGKHRGSISSALSPEETIGYIVFETRVGDLQNAAKYEAGLIEIVHPISNAVARTTSETKIVGAVSSGAGFKTSTGYFTDVIDARGNTLLVATDVDNTDLRTHADESSAFVAYTTVNVQQFKCSSPEKTECTCVQDDRCGWCKMSAGSGVCFPRNSGAADYCTAQQGIFSTEKNCTEEPTPVPVPVTFPAIPTTGTCKANTKCGCLTDTSCGWCQRPDGLGNCDDKQDSEMCVGRGFHWITEADDCPEPTSYEATRSLSVGEEFKNLSAYISIVGGCLILAVSIIVAIALRACGNRGSSSDL